MKNSKRFLSLTLAALAASCVDSVDKALLRGQASMQRQLDSDDSGQSPGCSGNKGDSCCRKNHAATWFYYCNLGFICSNNDGTGVCKQDEITAPSVPAPFCVPADLTACDALATGVTYPCTGGTCEDGATCDTCIQTCTYSSSPQNDQFNCDGGATCDPIDDSCCIQTDGQRYCH